MASKKKSHKGVVILLLGMCALGGGGVAWLNSEGRLEKAETDISGYRQEKVKRGNVETGITENGSVTFGTVEQVFEVAEITESETSSSSSGSSSSANTQSGAGAMSQAGGMGQAGAGNMGGMTGGTSAFGGSSNSGSSSSSSGTTTTLEVEEVYAKKGQSVKEGDQILKIAQDSIEAYQQELEAAVKSAELTVKQEEINLDKKKAEVEYTYQMYLVEGETAEETYKATIKKLEDAVADIEDDIEEKQEDVDTYQEYVDSGSDYEEELEDAQKELETLQANLLIAQNSLTTGSLEAKQTYETAMNNYKYADQLHEIDLDGIEDDLDSAKETLEDAQTALESFTEDIGDGIVYAQYTGTVTEVAYKAGDTITNEATIVTFTDPSNVTLDVSVSQEDISKISTGMEVTIELDAYKAEQFAGTVDGISTSSTAGSSTVNYEVSVLFTGDISKVYSGMTGNVNFSGEGVQDALYISNKAVSLDGTKSVVKVLEKDGTVQERTIKTGFSDGSVVEVLSGLEEGEIVLIG